MPIKNECGETKRRIAKYLEDIAAKEGLKAEVRFVEKKIIPRINPRSVYAKKRVLEFPNAILDELNENEIEAIGLHEVGHLARGSFRLRSVNMLAVAIGILLIEILLLSHLGLNPWLWFWIPIYLVSALYGSSYSVRWSEHKADKYAKNVIGKSVMINSILKLIAWAKKQKELRKWWRVILRKFLPMHPTIDSRIKFLEKDC